MAANYDQCRFAESLAKYVAVWNDKSADHADKTKRKAQMKALGDEFGMTRKYWSIICAFICSIFV